MTTRALPSPDAGGAWVIDLDGVIWLAGEPIAGGGEAVRRLRDAGLSVLFCSNNSAPSVATLLERMTRAGIDADPEEILTSAQAAASLLQPGTTALAVGEEGLTEALEARGIHVVEDGSADAVVVGWTRSFTFEQLTRASRAVWAGARLIGTNEDPSHPTPHGLLPGTGAILAAVATASGARPEVAGKPHEPLTRLVSQRAGRVAVVVGDRASTDGLLAQHLDVPFALVMSGVTTPDGPPPDPPPDVVADDLLAIVRLALG